MPPTKTPDRRGSTGDRRKARQDRRRPERQAEDVAPRRNPDVPDRRKS